MNNVSVVLMEPKFSGNIGAIARSMANFGFKNLVLVNPSCEINEEARNRAKHAQKILDDIKIFSSFDDLLNKFDTVIGTTGIIGTDYNLARSPVLSRDLSEKLLDYSGSVAIVFGREDDGLYNEELKRCDFTITIPSSDDYPVLNLSHAVTIILYDLFYEDKSEIMKEEHKALSAQEKDVLFGVINGLIDKTDFSTEDERITQKLIWKKFVGKAMLTKREGYGLIGFLKNL